LGEVMAPLQIMGGLIVIGSIIILQLNRTAN
jgi:drug/metabolite transporter (DMT)-like permease